MEDLNPVSFKERDFASILRLMSEKHPEVTFGLTCVNGRFTSYAKKGDVEMVIPGDKFEINVSMAIGQVLLAKS